VSVGTSSASVALSFDVESAHMGQVPFVSGEMLCGHLLECFLDLRVLIGQIQLVNICIDLLSPEVSVGLILRHGDHISLVDELISQLNWETEVQIKEARLAYILQLGACLTHLGLLVPGCLTGLPSEYGEGSLAHLALPREV
jgi:hypothetical protein